MIPEEVIAQVIERSDLVEIISAYIPLKKAGRNFKVLCPFHPEKTPSFVVNPDKQIFHCFGCGVGGNTVTFIMKQERLNFPEAIRVLAQRVGITIPEDREDQTRRDLRQTLYQLNVLAGDFFHQHLLVGKDTAARNAREYLKSRQVQLDTVKNFKLGFAPDQWDGLITFLTKKGYSPDIMLKAGLIIAQENPKREGFYDRFRNRITFPIYDIKGQCVGFGARSLKDGTAKYINSPETMIYTKGQHLYGFHLAKEAVVKKDTVIIVEGYMDCLMPFQMGVDNIAASLGTALTVEQIRLIHRYTQRVIFLFDMDKAGQSAMMRTLDSFLEQGIEVKIATLEEGEDPDSFIRHYGRETFEKHLQEAQSIFDYKLAQLMQANDVRTVEGKTHICQQMLLTINKVPNEIMKAEYIKRLSGRLTIREEALWAELKKVTSLASTGEKKRSLESSPVPSEIFRSAELKLLKLMLEYPHFIGSGKEHLDLKDFQNETIQLIFKGLFDSFDQGRVMDIKTVLSPVHDPMVFSSLSRTLLEEDALKGEPNKVFSDCVLRLKKDRMLSERKKLIEQIRFAESSGDHFKLTELKERFNQLIKG